MIQFLVRRRGGFGEVFDFAGFSHGGFLVEADFSRFVDDDGAALGAVVGFFAGPHVVGFGHFSGGIGQKMIGDVVLFFEGGVGEGGVARDAEDEGILIGGDFAQLGAESAMFGGARGA